MSVASTIPERAVSRSDHASRTTKVKDNMPNTQPFGSPSPGLKMNPGKVPAFTAEDMRTYLQSTPSCSLGPTLSGEPPTVESLEFVACKELTDRLHVHIGLADDAPVCYVVLRGPFLLSGVSYPPGGHHLPPFSETEEEIYDASTGRLLVAAAGSFTSWRKPGW